MWAHTAVAEHIDVGAEHVLQVLPQPHKVDQAPPRLHLNQEVHVAQRTRLPAHHRAEHAHVARAVVSSAAQDLLPPGTQPSKVDLDRCGTHACDHVTVAPGDSATRQPSREHHQAWLWAQVYSAAQLTRTDTDERYMTLPAETGPVFAPDRLSVWPVEDERYGL